MEAQTNTFLQGMDRDNSLYYVQDKAYRYAEDIRTTTDDNGTTGVLQPRDHIYKTGTYIEDNELILGVVSTKYCKTSDSEAEQVVVILTRDLRDGTNVIYRLDGADANNKDENLLLVPIFKQDLNITTRVGISANFENEYTSKVYFADGKSLIKCIDLNRSYDSSITYDIDIVPSSMLGKPEFVSTTTGQLQAGSVQYAYCLFNKYSSMSRMSSLSNIIPIVEVGSNSQSTNGLDSLDVSTMGVKMLFELNSDDFTYYDVYRIYYASSSDTPTVTLITERELPKKKKGDIITFIDRGTSTISTMSIEEFANIVGNIFTTNIIEVHLNRLFAANVLTDTWDVDYDARAYRADISGRAKIESVDSSEDMIGVLTEDGKIGGISVPANHDCINPSNEVIGGQYRQYYIYDANGKIGGTGPNISYRMVYTDIILSDNSVSTAGLPNKPSLNHTTNELTINASAIASGTRKYYYMDGSEAFSEDFDQEMIPNYSGVSTCEKLTGYKRDEVYRFGIIFYNDKGDASPVHWIGDIKMPDDYPFETGVSSSLYKQSSVTKLVELKGKALGIKFDVKNVPDTVNRWEIVRCRREKKDRTILSQGILSSLWTYSGDENVGNSGAFPNFWPQCNYGDVQSIWAWNSEGMKTDDDKLDIVTDLMEMITPESAFAPTDSIQYFLDASLVFKKHLGVRTGNVISSYKNTKYLQFGSGMALYQTINNDADNQGKYWDGKTTIDSSKINCDYTSTSDNLGFNNISSTGYRAGDAKTTRGPIIARKDFAVCGTMKYFMTGDESVSQTNDYYTHIDNAMYKIDSAIETTIWDDVLQGDDISAVGLSSKVQPISNYSYVNVNLCRHACLAEPHGKSLIVKLTSDQVPSTNINNNLAVWNLATCNSVSAKDQQFGLCNSVPLVDIYNTKANPYDGNLYTDRQYSTYISTGCCHKASESTGICYGGDTYLCVFDWQSSWMNKDNNNSTSCIGRRAFFNSYIPVETIYNLNLRHDQCFSKILAKDYTTAYLCRYNPVAFTNYVQNKPMYLYNDAYSASPLARMYTAKAEFDTDKNNYINRIVVSELKTNGEIKDSWCTFKFANYLDVDNKYGLLTNLLSFGNKLYFWVDNGFGIVSSGERTIITDLNSSLLTLGTGSVLERADFAASYNGSSIVNDKSITTSEGAIYWYDTLKNELVQFAGQLNCISKQKLVQSDLNSRTTELRLTDVVSLFDKKHNEIWFKIDDKVLVYSESLQQFVSYYNMKYDWKATFYKYGIVIDTDADWLLRIYWIHRDDDRYKSIDRKSRIQLVINQNAGLTKAFDNVWFTGELVDPDNKLDPHIVESVKFETKTLSTVSDTVEPIDYKSIENREDNYRLFIPREAVSQELTNKSKSFLGRMRGKYLLSDFTFDTNKDKSFKIPYISTTYRYSML